MWPSSRFPNMNAVPPNRWGARVISPQELTAAVIRFLALRTDITSSRFTVHCSQFTVSVWGWQFAVGGWRFWGGLFWAVRGGRGGEDGIRLCQATRLSSPNVLRRDQLYGTNGTKG